MRYETTYSLTHFALQEETGHCFLFLRDSQGLSGIVMIDDDNMDVSDFITLSDDTIFLSDADVHDTFSTDIDGADLSFML